MPRGNAAVWIGAVVVLVLCLAPQRADADPDAPVNSMAPPGMPPPGPFVVGMPGMPVPPGFNAAMPSMPGAPAIPGGALPTAPEPELVINAKPVSLFVTPEELARINEAIATYKRNKDKKNNSAENQAKNFLNQLEPLIETSVEQQAVPFTYPQFFLQTLSYKGPDDWLVVVNGEKFVPRYENPASWLKVVMVDKESVVMEWRPQNMEKVQESWMVAPLGVDASDVLVDSARDTVTFTLKPNQTFTSYAMRVVEGRVQPVTVMVDPDTAVASPVKKTGPKVAAPAKPKAAVNAPVAAPVSPGEPGLNDTYKRIGLE